MDDHAVILNIDGCSATEMQVRFLPARTRRKEVEMEKIDIFDAVIEQFGEWEVDGVRVKDFPFLNDIVDFIIDKVLQCEEGSKYH